MKLFLSFVIGLILSSYILVGDTEEYLIIFENSNITRYFQSGNRFYFEYFLEQKEKIGEFEYSVKIRKYSWGGKDTSYFRMDDKYFYHYNEKILAESIVIPRVPQVGQNWHESDSSWMYTILKTDQIFKTPIKDYYNCILMECKQLTGRDKNKSEVYNLYYSKGNGYVGDVDSEGEILSYLRRTVDDADLGIEEKK